MLGSRPVSCWLTAWSVPSEPTTPGLTGICEPYAVVVPHWKRYVVEAFSGLMSALSVALVPAMADAGCVVAEGAPAAVVVNVRSALVVVPVALVATGRARCLVLGASPDSVVATDRSADPAPADAGVVDVQVPAVDGLHSN